MLKITIPSTELFDDSLQEFIEINSQVLTLEHSLVSISKWEAKWNKPFLVKGEKTREETLDYIRCMTLTQNVKDTTYKYIPDYIIDEIRKYIDADMTATKITQENNTKSREIITSELIYYWMIALNIPPEYQKWHLNRLLTLINVCNIKNSPPKKVNKKEVASKNAALNAARKQQLQSKG